MNKSPKSIKRVSENSLEIIWSDTTCNKIDSKILRLNCPCASCQEKRGENTHSKPLTSKKSSSLLKVIDADIQQETALLEIWPVGNYAIGCKWADGHATGIYSYSLLSQIAEIKQ